MKYYICYIKDGDGSGAEGIWGTGKSRLEARNEAKRYINEYFSGSECKPNFNTDLATIECTEDLFDYVVEHGDDDYLEWDIGGKKASLIDGKRETEEDLRSRLSRSCDKINSLKPENESILSEILRNQIPIMKALVDLKEHFGCR